MDYGMPSMKNAMLSIAPQLLTESDSPPIRSAESPSFAIEYGAASRLAQMVLITAIENEFAAVSITPGRSRTIATFEHSDNRQPATVKLPAYAAPYLALRLVIMANWRRDSDQQLEGAFTVNWRNAPHTVCTLFRPYHCGIRVTLTVCQQDLNTALNGQSPGNAFPGPGVFTASDQEHIQLLGAAIRYDGDE